MRRTIVTDNNKKDLKQAGRRQFLKTIAAGSAVAGVAAVTATQAAASTGEQETAPASNSQNGYRETDHIRAYYDTLR
jgi:nitrous oxide reductase